MFDSFESAMASGSTRGSERCPESLQILDTRLPEQLYPGYPKAALHQSWLRTFVGMRRGCSFIFMRHSMKARSTVSHVLMAGSPCHRRTLLP
jgi:hypothetical protein